LFVSVAVEPAAGPRLLDLLNLPALAGVLPESEPGDLTKMHMTLAFLGDRQRRDLTAIHESVERSVSGLDAFDLTAVSVMTLPRGQPGRLLAAVTDGPPALLEIQRRLATRLIRPIERGKRTTFLPHVTLTRWHEAQSCDELEIALEAGERVTWHVGAIRLMHSVHYAGHTEHRIVRDFELNT